MNASFLTADVNLTNDTRAFQHNTGECYGHAISTPAPAAVSGRRLKMLFSAAVATLIAGLPGAGPATVMAAPAPRASTESARADWLDLFVSVMQDVLWLMGGDAVAIDTSSPDNAMAGFRARVSELGIPAGLSPTDAAALKAAVDHMDQLLSDAPNTASEEEIRRTRSTLSQLRAVPAESSLTRSSP